MRLHKAEVRFERPLVEQVEATVAQQFKRKLFGSCQNIAVAVGSRRLSGRCRCLLEFALRGAPNGFVISQPHDFILMLLANLLTIKSFGDIIANVT